GQTHTFRGERGEHLASGAGPGGSGGHERLGGAVRGRPCRKPPVRRSRRPVRWAFPPSASDSAPAGNASRRATIGLYKPACHVIRDTSPQPTFLTVSLNG